MRMHELQVSGGGRVSVWAWSTARFSYTSFVFLNRKASRLEKTGDIVLSRGESNTLDKYTFSNAMSLSVKLGIWEALLENYIDSIEILTEDLKKGKKIRISREECLRKHGELFALRHLINLGSDLLDVPDFYWEYERLEQLYLQTCAYFSISKRTKVCRNKRVFFFFVL